MNRIIILILAIIVLTNCNNLQTKTKEKNARIELVPEPDRDLRAKYEAAEKLRKLDCVLSNPDTSLCGIKIRNSESAVSIIGNSDKVDSLEQYHYYSSFDRETLTLTQHPGDGKYQISIFKVEYSNKADYGYRQLKIDTFKTEKGIKLGMSKNQVIERLGYCYMPIDSTENCIGLFYRIEIPKDSKTKLLKNNNMPVYFAYYGFWKNTLERFEFGFEYP
jgi:hypothetical protein